jgi:hypothetical protein
MGADAVPASDISIQAKPWWDQRWFLALVVLATMVPLLYPQFPPFVDVPGHLGHYRVELDVGHSPWLSRYYGFHWAPIGNLGVDILIIPLARLIGLEPAVKLIVLAIPPLTAFGMLWVAREVHGRVPPTAFFALPFIFGAPFLFGFLNYTLSVALAFLAFALWLRLGRLRKTRLRGWLFAPIGLIIFFCHTYGWALLGLMCFSAETVRLRDSGRPWWREAFEAALHTSVLALPLLVMMASPIESRGGMAGDWFDWDAKWVGIYGALRDRWGPFDVSSLEFAGVILAFAILSPKFAFSRSLAFLTVVLAVSFVLLPRFIFDSAYADVRLLPYLFAVALLAIGLSNADDRRPGQFLAIFALVFFGVRLAGTTASMAMAADDQQAKLEALDHIPRGARVASFYGLSYAEPWALQRNSHLGGLVIARREGFSNDQWITAGHNLLVLRYREAGTFSANPSQVVRPNGTHDGVYRTIDEALAEVPKDKFDYIWLIRVPPFDQRLVGDLQPVWRGPGTTLYRIPH